MRYLSIALLALLLFGCSGESTTSAPVTLVDPVPGPQLLTITPENALVLSAVLDELLIPSGRNSVELAGGNLSLIEIDGVAAAMVELPLAYPVLAQGASGRFSGPGGGSADVTVNGPGVTVTFNNFVTQDGTMLNGIALMSSSVGEILVTFENFQVTDSDGMFLLDGPVTLSLDRFYEPDRFFERVERTQHVTLTDLTHGGTVRIIDGDSEAEIEIGQGVQTGTGTNRGSFLFDGFRGLSGEVFLVPDVPYGFNVELATLTSSVTSGQNYIQGDGTLRRRIVAPNLIETALQAPGAADFVVVGVTDIRDEDDL